MKTASTSYGLFSALRGGPYEDVLRVFEARLGRPRSTWNQYEWQWVAERLAIHFGTLARALTPGLNGTNLTDVRQALALHAGGLADVPWRGRRFRGRPRKIPKPKLTGRDDANLERLLAQHERCQVKSGRRISLPLFACAVLKISEPDMSAYRLRMTAQKLAQQMRDMRKKLIRTRAGKTAEK